MYSLDRRHLKSDLYSDVPLICHLPYVIYSLEELSFYSIFSPALYSSEDLLKALCWVKKKPTTVVPQIKVYYLLFSEKSAKIFYSLKNLPRSSILLRSCQRFSAHQKVSQSSSIGEKVSQSFNFLKKTFQKSSNPQASQKSSILWNTAHSSFIICLIFTGKALQGPKF